MSTGVLRVRVRPPVRTPTARNLCGPVRPLSDSTTLTSIVPCAEAVVTPSVCAAESISSVTAVLGANPSAVTCTVSPAHGVWVETEMWPSGSSGTVLVVVDEVGGGLPVGVLAV